VNQRALRVALYVLVGFVLGSLILGTIKGNPFVDNLVYGSWTGALAGTVVGGSLYLLGRRRHGQTPD
jgi:hypothetical protein